MLNGSFVKGAVVGLVCAAIGSAATAALAGSGSVHSTPLQKRVTGKCGAGKSIVSIAAAGTVGCTTNLAGASSKPGTFGVAGASTCSTCTNAVPLSSNAAGGHFTGTTGYGVFGYSSGDNAGVFENNTNSWYTLLAQADSSGGYPFKAGNAQTGGYMYLDPNGNLVVSGTVTANGKVLSAPRHAAPGHTPVGGDRPSSGTNALAGTVVTDSRGIARVRLPSGTAVRAAAASYSLTGVGRRSWDARIGVWQPVAHGAFVIRSSRPHVTVSWRITVGS